MPKAKKRNVDAQNEIETQQQIELDPIAAGERYREQLGMMAEKALRAIDGVTGKGLSKARDADREYVGFSHDLAEATGRKIYEVRQSFHARLGSDFLRRQLAVIKHGAAMPPVKQSALAAKIIEAIKAKCPRPQPKVFEGQAEWVQYLKDNNLTEAPAGYLPETKSDRYQKYGY
jgi:hypothetical protein